MSGREDIWSAVDWPRGWDVRHVAETGSTNTDLVEALLAGTAGDRTVLATDHQTAGRGRLDRRWDAPPGANLLVSIVIAPVPSRAAHATQRVGVAAAAAVREFRPEAAVGLKWPNDVLLDGGKVAGILAQRAPAADAVVIGLGLNVRWAPDGAARVGDHVEPAVVLRSVLEALDGLPADPGAEYRRELSTLGRRVRVDLPDGTAWTGRATDVDADGRLVVEDPGGRARTFDVGDVVHVRPSGGDATS